MLRRTAIRARRPVSAFLVEPAQRKNFNETFEYCNAKNMDMATCMTSDFCLLQSKLLKYRVVRLREEMRYISRNPFGSLPGFIPTCKHLILLSVVFLFSWCAGRFSFGALPRPRGDDTIPLGAHAEWVPSADKEKA